MSILLPFWGVPDALGGTNPHALFMSLNSTLYLRFNEASGSAINYGSDGGTGTVSGCTQAQQGQLGPGEAVSFDGVDDVVTLANAAVPATKALATQRWCFLVNASSLGEGNVGALMVWNTGTTTIRFGGGNVLFARVDTNGTDVNAIAAAGQVNFLTQWALVFVDCDAGGELGLGFRLRLIKATAASPAALMTLGTDTAGTGSVIVPTGTLTLGNSAATTTTLAGLMDVALAGAGLWSPAGAPADLTLCQRIRHEVFNV
jgi:hypothetical protein